MPITEFSTQNNFPSQDLILPAPNGVFLGFTITSIDPPVTSLVFWNGLAMTQPVDVSIAGGGRGIEFVPSQVPHTGDIITAECFIPDQFGLNAPQQYSTNDGTLSGALNGVNNAFGLSLPPTSLGNGTTVLVTALSVWWNGLFMTPGIDYVWQPPAIIFITKPYPSGTDIVTAQAWFQ